MPRPPRSFPASAPCCFFAVWLVIGGLAGLDRDEACHLLRRTGFGVHPDDLAAFLPLSREQAVDRLLSEVRTVAATSPPEWATAKVLGAAIALRRETWREIWALPDGEDRNRRAEAQRRVEAVEAGDLRAWWMRELIGTPSPLTERLVLFWHNHFTSQLSVVQDARLMYEQNVLFRRQAAGNVAELLLAIVHDPAMFVYLDGASNVAGHPNENFAREVMELFAIGEGFYSETDVREAARAFTGYRTDPGTGRPVKDEEQHDHERKSILGNKGVFDGDGVIKILLTREERVAVHLSEKLWREFVDDELDAKAVYQLAATLYRNRYELKPLLRVILLSDHFWDRKRRGGLIRSPVDLYVGTVRSLGLTVRDHQALVVLARDAGQFLFEPPNVKGWPGGRAWLGSQGLLIRNEGLAAIRTGLLQRGGEREAGGMMGDPATAKSGAAKSGTAALPGQLDSAVLASLRSQGAAAAASMITLQLPLPPAPPITTSDVDAALAAIHGDLACQLR